MFSVEYVMEADYNLIPNFVILKNEPNTKQPVRISFYLRYRTILLFQEFCCGL